MIQSGVAKPGCLYPKVAGHPKPLVEPAHPPVVPCLGSMTKGTIVPVPLASKKKPPSNNATAWQPTPGTRRSPQFSGGEVSAPPPITQPDVTLFKWSY